jgi:polysaccharide export outer membrane protein
MRVQKGRREMARTLLALALAGLLGAWCPAFVEGANELALPADAGSTGHIYPIGPGDILEVSVWKDEALTRSCTVRPDGSISFPLIGEIPAAGKTLMELKSEMEGKLKKFVPDVVLYIDVKQINSLIIYVIGKVNNPGRFILTVDVNVLQALSTAGGLNPFAKGGKVKIFRQGSNETTIFPFNYDEVVDGKRLEQNIYLRRGDVVVVP